MIKTLKNILSAAGILFALSIPNETDLVINFNLSGLEPWQEELFIKAGRDFWGIEIRKDNASKNEAYFFAFPGGSGPIARVNREITNEELSYKILFNKKYLWADCSRPNAIGRNFHRISGHEMGHVLGHEKGHLPMYEHNGDFYSLMYKIETPMDFCSDGK